jgi:hypothetical protein
LLETEMLPKKLDRREIAVSLAWSVIESESDLGSPGLAEVPHRGTFRDVLSKEAVGVLVRTAFPGVVWSGEVEGRAGGALGVAVTMELGSVVYGDCFE